VVLWLLIGRPRIGGAAALGIALAPALVVAGWAFSRPGLTKQDEPRSLQVHDGRWFALALVLGGTVVFGLAWWVSRHERRRPLVRAWRLRLGRLLVGAAVVAVAVGIGALLAAGITPSRVLHKFSEPTAPPVVSGATHLTSVASPSRGYCWQEAWESWRAQPAVGR